MKILSFGFLEIIYNIIVNVLKYFLKLVFQIVLVKIVFLILTDYFYSKKQPSSGAVFVFE
nr:MAG TPA: hypothetical protein [Caudoviricetes sp.]